MTKTYFFIIYIFVLEKVLEIFYLWCSCNLDLCNDELNESSRHVEFLQILSIYFHLLFLMMQLMKSYPDNLHKVKIYNVKKLSKKKFIIMAKPTKHIK